MRKRIVYAVLSGFIAGGVLVSSVAKEYQGADVAADRSGNFAGLRAVGAGLQVDVPFEPTAFASAGGDNSAYELAPPKVDESLRLLEPFRLQRDDSAAHQRNSKPSARGIYLAYELVLTNIGSAPLTLKRIEIAGGSRGNSKPIVAYEGSQLEALLALPDRRGADADINRLQIRATERVVINLFLSFQGRKFVPETLRHHVYTNDTVIEVPLVGTRHTQMRALGPPLKGGNWFVMGGPGATGVTTYHRHNTYILNGRPEAARRYAIDWVKVVNGEMQSGQLASNPSYYGYGQEVLAVADGIIVTASDGMPDNVPGQVPSLDTFAPVCLFCGNHVVLQLAHGQFATYMHLQPGSLRVAKADRVRRGQVLGLVGNSGESFTPHLHFQVTTEPGTTGQGLPYLIERFSIIDPIGAPQRRTRELPLDGMLVDFGS